MSVEVFPPCDGPHPEIALVVAGRALRVGGHGAWLDGQGLALTATGLTLLRLLALPHGAVVPRRTLLEALPGDGIDEHAVEVAIARLRASLGDPSLVQTVVKRGYRLAVDRA